MTRTFNPVTLQCPCSVKRSDNIFRFSNCFLSTWLSSRWQYPITSAYDDWQQLLWKWRVNITGDPMARLEMHPKCSHLSRDFIVVSIGGCYWQPILSRCNFFSMKCRKFVFRWKFDKKHKKVKKLKLDLSKPTTATAAASHDRHRALYDVMWAVDTRMFIFIVWK